MASFLSMARRPTHRRAQDIKPGRVAGWPADRGDPRDIAQRVGYLPDGKHKDYPAPNGEWDHVRSSEGTKCARVLPEHQITIVEALQEAIVAGVVSEEFRGDFPARIWAYVDNRLHEARLSNQEQGQYHGFPLDYEEHFPADPDDRLAGAPRV